MAKILIGSELRHPSPRSIQFVADVKQDLSLHKLADEPPKKMVVEVKNIREDAAQERERIKEEEQPRKERGDEDDWQFEPVSPQRPPVQLNSLSESVDVLLQKSSMNTNNKTLKSQKCILQGSKKLEMSKADEKSFFDRLGGERTMAMFVEDFMEGIMADPGLACHHKQF